ncbi:MAG: RnfABCDGE type electron transport complex subunit D [Pseudomonadota bacterium]
MTASAHILEKNSVSRVMLLVLACLLPGVLAYAWQFGWGIVINLAWASVLALALEALALGLRSYPLKPFLADGSALVTAWLLALSLPPLAPWWLTLVGMIFAIGVAKHLYGGLGQNIFNPAMVGFAVLIISFPAQMTQWSAPLVLASHPLTFGESLAFIFGGGLPAGVTIDAVVTATPLDTVRTGLLQQHTLDEIRAASSIFGSIGGVGGEWVAAGYLVGGIALWALRIVPWQVPAAFLAGIWLTAGFLHWADVGRYAAPWFQIASPSAMLGAFFIATDPVSGATTPRGRLIFGLGAGFLTVIIRVFGGYPDGVAFAILLMNLCVPLIDAWTRPPVFGEAKKK